MIHQIDQLASSIAIQGALLRWLRARCANTEHHEPFQAAMKRYFESGGKDIALVGVLLRDTPPNLDDLRARGTTFEAKKHLEPKIRLDAWYVPRQISEWVATMSATGP
jgi:hypothetical protein